MDILVDTQHIILVLLLILMRSVSISSEDESKCNKEIIDVCLNPLKKVSYDVSKAVVPHLDEETLRDHCRRYNMFEACMEDVQPYCSFSKQLIYKGTEDAYRWMCQDGFDEYLKYSKCFNNKQLHSEGSTCNKTLTQNLEKIKKNAYGTSYKTKYICLYLDQYLDCVQNVVEAFCGTSAAIWQRTLDEKSVIPVLNAINCHIAITQKQKTTHWVPIAIGIALSLSLLIIFMAIMLLFLHKRKRRQPVSSETNPAVPIAPPPYEEPLPFIVYNGHVGNMVMFNNDQAAPIPNKADPSSISIPVPPYSKDASLAVHGQESRCNEAVDTGYFGASGSGVTASHETEDEAVETIDKPEDDLSALHRFNSTTSDITGINNPTYEELDAVGYFGTTSPSK